MSGPIGNWTVDLPLLYVQRAVGSVTGSVVTLISAYEAPPGTWPSPNVVVGGTGCLDGTYPPGTWTLDATGTVLTLLGATGGTWSGRGAATWFPADYADRLQAWQQASGR